MRGDNLFEKPHFWILGSITFFSVMVVAVLSALAAPTAIPVSMPSNVDLDGIDPDSELLRKIDEENHTPFDLLGLHASPSFPTVAADADTMTPYVFTGGNNGWGPWLPMVGSGDTPFRTDKDTYDVHELLLSSVSTASFGRIQIGWDATTSTVILANETYSSVGFKPEGIGANVGVGFVNINMPDVDNGMLIFGRCWIDGENGATVSVFLNTHAFDK